MKPSNYQLAKGQVEAIFKTKDGIIKHKRLNTPHDNNLPCKKTILQWRLQQVKAKKKNIS